MTNATRVLLLIAGLTLGAGACTSRVQVVHRTPTPTETTESETETTETETTQPAPTTGVPVEVTIASVTLGDDCPAPPTAASDSLVQQPVAADAPAAGAPAMRSSHGRFAAGYCQRTGLQLSVTAPDHHPGGTLEVVAVRLLTMEQELVQGLEVRGQTLFVDGQYVAWDGTVSPGQQNVSLHTSGPDWSTIGGDRGGYGQSFRVEVDVNIGGETRTLDMSPVSREAMVVT